jgi:nucleoside-diphosphate-sugar epimerase
MKKNILVTGGCGYIGSVLVPVLVGRGYTIRVFDKLYFGDETLGNVRKEIELIPGDVRNFKPEILDGIDSVIHLGSLSNDPTAEFHPRAAHSINYTGTIKLARACKERGIEKFIFASSCAVYGFRLDEPVDENSPVDPQSEYAKSKADVDRKLQSMADSEFCPVSLRQATVYGFSPRMRWDIVVNAFVMHAFQSGRLDVWFGGDAWRPLVHVRDTTEAHICCLEADPDKVRGEIFNLVSENYRILELAQDVKKALADMGISVEIDVNYDEVDNRSYVVNGDKIATTLEYTPKVTVGEGVKEIAGILREGKYRNFDHPIYYNMPWMKLLIDVEERLKKTGKVL